MTYVIVRLMGGLGNQMFQYATGYSVAQRLQVPLLLDRGFPDDRTSSPRETARAFELDVYQVPYAFASGEQVARARRVHDSTLVRWLAHAFPWMREHFIVEQGITFDPRPGRVQAPVYLQGYWQSERYFSDIADMLRRELFVPREQPDARNLALLKDIRSKPTASLHVRRGDYVSDPATANHHGVLPIGYYTEAADRTVEQHAVEAFVVFSDDPDWTKQHLPLPRPAVHVDWNIGRNAHWDLYLMRHCAHHIIANSSFSWWGAWLNPDPAKTVIAPERWFRDPSIDMTDLIPASWTRI